jgi:hypothetical protein
MLLRDNFMENIVLKFWNNFYYANVCLSDGTKIPDIKSADELTYKQWIEKAEKMYADSQIPPVVEICLCPQCVAKECPKGIK